MTHYFYSMPDANREISCVVSLKFPPPLYINAKHWSYKECRSGIVFRWGATDSLAVLDCEPCPVMLQGLVTQGTSTSIVRGFAGKGNMGTYLYKLLHKVNLLYLLH